MFTDEINEEWSDYYKSFAYKQLEDYGVIFLDYKGYPTDNLEEIKRVEDLFIRDGR